MHRASVLAYWCICNERGSCGIFNKKAKYPENPLLENTKTIKEIAKNNNKSEEEMNQELLYMTLRVRQTNARLEKR